MEIGLIGFSYRSAELRLREYLIKVTNAIFMNPKNEFTFSIVPLVTCNRIEFYFESPDLEEASLVIYNTLLENLRHFDIELSSHVYSYFHQDCFVHLVRVTTGLDSILPGETEIQGQVKRAYQEGVVRGGVSCGLHFLFQKALKISKEIRTTWNLRPSNSLESIIFDTMSVFKKDLVKSEAILFIGFSKINRKIANFFASNGWKSLVVYSTQPAPTDRSLFPYEMFYSRQTFDDSRPYQVIVSGSDRIDVNDVFSRLVYSKETLVFDISVPRSLDPSLGTQVRLFNMDFINAQSSRFDNEKWTFVIDRINKKIFSEVNLQFDLFEKKTGYPDNCFVGK